MGAMAGLPGQADAKGSPRSGEEGAAVARSHLVDRRAYLQVADMTRSLRGATPELPIDA
jgi:hypothetical protein